MTSEASPGTPVDTLAEYSCDTCRTRKVACSRRRPTCQRCSEEGIDCVYSRHGIIRRHRRRKNDRSRSGRGSPYGFYLSPLNTETEQTQAEFDSDQLGGETPQGALDKLFETSAAVWLQDDAYIASEARMIKQRFILFEDRMDEWTDLFLQAMARGKPMFFDPPAGIVQLFRQAQPHHVKERAWLVTFYSVVLSNVTSTSPNDVETKNKLISNLWTAFNDARLLLEPSESTIQALVILAVHVEEFTTPTLSWTLITNACRMLQTLGVNQRKLTPETRARRTMLFWYLNLLDKGLAVVFNRPPTFHRAMSSGIPMPQIDQLVDFRPHLETTNSAIPGLFRAHYLYQLMQLSCIIGDIWTCLYEDTTVHLPTVEVLLSRVDNWFENAIKILHAAAVTELPFLSEQSKASINIGMNMPIFQRSYLTLLLTRASPMLRTQGLQAANTLLAVLDKVVPSSKEVFNGIIWQLVCCPFTAFLTLFAETLSGRMLDISQRQLTLVSMQQLPTYLSRIGSTNSLAARLYPIAKALTKYAMENLTRVQGRSMGSQHIESSLDMLGADLSGEDIEIADQLLLPEDSFPEDFFDWDAIFTGSNTDELNLAELDHAAQTPKHRSQFDFADLNADPVIDWFSWE